MLTIPTYVAPSQIHGMGCFAGRFVPAGEVIWTFHSNVDFVVHRNECFPVDMYHLEKIYEKFFYVDSSGACILRNDNAKYINHSPVPNCDMSVELLVKAIQDIAEGDEITLDYRTFDKGITPEKDPYVFESTHMGSHGV